MGDAIDVLAGFVDGTAGPSEARAAIDALRLDAALTRAAVATGVAPEALEDFLGRGRRAFAGPPGFSRADPTRRLTPESWAEDLRPAAPHLFRRG